MTRALLLLPILGMTAPALAQPLAAPASHLRLTYEAYAAGLNVLHVETDIDLTARSYRLDTTFRTAGLFGSIIHAETQSIAAGLWGNHSVMPSRFYSYGHLRGNARRTQIDYLDGQPAVKILEPADEDEREPVPQAEQRNSVDTLSAIALLVHEVAVTGRCAGSARIFDGRRLSEITVTDGGTETLAPERGSMLQGPAHRCDFEGRQLAGFAKDADPAEVRRPQRGAAWLAPVAAGDPPLPVRMSFHTRFFGDATMFLTTAAAASPPG